MLSLKGGIMKYLTVLISFSLLSATITNTATLTLSDDVFVTINGNFNNSGNIFINDYSHLEINGCYSDDGGNIYGSHQINSILGDINCDTSVDILDIQIMVNMALPNDVDPIESADVNNEPINHTLLIDLQRL